MIKIMRNCKRGERRSQRAKRSSESRNFSGMRNFAAQNSPMRNDSHPQGARCKIKGWLQKWPSAAKWFCSPRATPCENFHNYETLPWHTSAISQPHTLISQLRNGLRKCPLATKMAFGCEMTFGLRNGLRKCLLAAKSPIRSQLVSQLIDDQLVLLDWGSNQQNFITYITMH